METSIAATGVFERILVGIDSSETSMQACRLANRLCTASGHVVAVAVAETSRAVHTGMEAPMWSARLRAQAIAARDAVVEELGDPRMRADVVVGSAPDALLSLIREHDAELVAVGAGTASRTAGFVVGSVATRLIHDAPCSVLVVRGDQDAERFPERIVVGLDGSEPAAAAGALAQRLAKANGGELRHVVATGGKPLTSTTRVDAELDPRSPVDALAEASSSCDLLVVGSRGLHGVASLGSVAERVAHAAHCSVLIVRR